MTLLEAQDRATNLWRRSGIHGGIDRVFYVSHTKFGVELAGDERMHVLDANGHVDCGHSECLARERQIDAYRDASDTKTDAARTDNPSLTGSDALARLNAARFGSLVKPDGRPLDGDNLPYLRTLLTELHRFSDAVLIELNRIERIAER